MAIYVSVGIGLLGFLPLLIVLWKRQRIKKLKQNGDRVTGVVDDIIERTGSKGNRYCQAIIRYTVFGGRTLRGTYTYSSFRKRPLFTRGEQIEVYYSKNKPEKFIPQKGPTYSAALIFTSVIAVAYIVISFLLYDFIRNGG